MLNYLNTTTALVSADYPQLPDMAEDRVMIAKAVLGREPVVLRNKFTGLVVWVESEPADWRDFLTQNNPKTIAQAARRLH